MHWTVFPLRNHHTLVRTVLALHVHESLRNTHFVSSAFYALNHSVILNVLAPRHFLLLHTIKTQVVSIYGRRECSNIYIYIYMNRIYPRAYAECERDMICSECNLSSRSRPVDMVVWWRHLSDVGSRFGQQLLTSHTHSITHNVKCAKCNGRAAAFLLYCAVRVASRWRHNGKSQTTRWPMDMMTGAVHIIILNMVVGISKLGLGLIIWVESFFRRIESRAYNFGLRRSLRDFTLDYQFFFIIK